MKKITSMIAIILLFSLFFTGCNIYGVARFTTSSPIPLPIPIKQDFSSYGVSFKIAGSVTEVEGNKYGSAKFRTTLGNFEFERLF